MCVCACAGARARARVCACVCVHARVLFVRVRVRVCVYVCINGTACTCIYFVLSVLFSARAVSILLQVFLHVTYTKYTVYSITMQTESLVILRTALHKNICEGCLMKFLDELFREVVSGFQTVCILSAIVV